MTTAQTGSALSTLLPQASVALHVMDAELRQAAHELKSDWRFARVNFDIREGDVEAAIGLYSTTESPELIIVETASIGEDFSSRLEVLAGNCASNTSAVVVGPVNDVYLYRKLIDMGVTDYLVRPIKKEVLAEVIGKALIDKVGASESRLIAFMGAKGGVGTSTLAQNTGYAIASLLNQKTLILDAAGGSSYLAVAMGTEPATTLSEAARAAVSSDQDAFKRLLTNVSDRLAILASGADTILDEMITAEQYDSILSRLLTTWPVVVVDLSGASASIRRLVIHRAHEVVLITTPSLPSLRCARTLLQEIRDVRGGSDQDVELLLNMQGVQPGNEISKADIESAMERKITLSIPYDQKLFSMLETQGKKLIEQKGAEEIVSGLMKIVRKVIHAGDEIVAPEKKVDPSSLSGFLQKIISK